MKGIVLEIKNHTAAVLRDDGTVVKLYGDYTVGQTVELKPERKPWYTQPQMRIAFTAAVIILSLGIGSVYNYTTVEAASVVTVEGTVGVQLTLNRRNQVIAVSSTDESGEEMKERLEEAQILGASFTDAVELTREVYQYTYDSESSELSFSVTSKDPKIEERMRMQLGEIEQSQPGISQEPSEKKEPDHTEIQEPFIPHEESMSPDQPPIEGQQHFGEEQKELNDQAEQLDQTHVDEHEERPKDENGERFDLPFEQKQSR